MPNFYTHLRFARQVADGLSPELQEKLRQEWDSYCCGNFGPDPLYFTGFRQVGLRLHHGSGRDALERYREAVRQDSPYGESFASGYFLHFLLDSSLHPLIYRAMEESGCSHRQVEGELDRRLLMQDEQKHREAMPVRPLSRGLAYMASKMAPEVTAEAYEKGLKYFRFVSMKLCDWTGTPMKPVTNLVSRISGMKGGRGAVLGKEPDPKLSGHLDGLEEAYYHTLRMAPALLERFLEDARQGREFSPVMNKDFSGKEVV